MVHLLVVILQDITIQLAQKKVVGFTIISLVHILCLDITFNWCIITMAQDGLHSHLHHLGKAELKSSSKVFITFWMMMRKMYVF